MKIVKSGSIVSTAPPFLKFLVVILLPWPTFCLGLSVNHERDNGSLPLAKQNPTLCSTNRPEDKNRLFEVKKQNYLQTGILESNIPLRAQFGDGQFEETKDNNSHLYDEIGFYSVEKLVRRIKQWDVLVYNVTTDDSYILKLYRIVNRKGRKPNTGTPVVLQHGLWGTCKDWLMLDDAGSLAFSAAASKFDVWLANSRGQWPSDKQRTDEGREHEYFSRKNTQYWDFSFDEMGRYDTKAVIDKVLKEARRESLYYVGHSLGTILFYTFMHYHGNEYRDKIKGMVAIPPSAYLYKSETPLIRLQTLAPFVTPLGVPLNAPFPLFQSQLQHILPLLCSVPVKNSDLCTTAFYAIAGVSQRESKTEIFKRMVAHYPNGLSIKTAIHLLQLTQRDGFRMFDHGPARNFLIYNQLAAPSYNLFGIEVQTFNIFGLQDLIVDRSDAERVVAALGTSRGKTNQLIFEFNHLDLILSEYAAPIINSRILVFFNVLEKGSPPDNKRCECECGKNTCPRPTFSNKTTTTVKPPGKPYFMPQKKFNRKK